MSWEDKQRKIARQKHLRCSKTLILWAALESKCNLLDGVTEHFILYDWRDRQWLRLFATKRECAAWIKETHGYVARRADLRREPHCNRMPQARRVTVTIGEISVRKFPGRWRRKLAIRRHNRR